MSFRSKRHRTPSQSSSSTSTSTPESNHPSKTSRVIPSEESAPGVVTRPLLCTLPPTCNHRPTPIANTRDLETHYATYHAHVCEERGCGSVFPDPRLLELHQTECHDPIAAVRKDKGEKIFACHLPTCARLFLTPKARRLHLIQAHGYPKEYFFAVTNKGVGGLLKKWGEGVSLIRGPWKERDKQETKDEKGDDVGESEEDEETAGSLDQMDSDNDKRNDLNEANMDEGEDPSVEGLTKTMDSLNLVPPSIRFGRGGKNGGFVQNGRAMDITMDHSARGVHMRGRGRGRGWRGSFPQVGGSNALQTSVVMEVDPSNSQSSVRGGLGRAAGRGRAGIMHVTVGRARGRAIS